MLRKIDGIWSDGGTAEYVNHRHPDPYRKVAAAVIERALKDYAEGLELFLCTPEELSSSETRLLRESEEAFLFLVEDTLYHRYINLDPEYIKAYLFRLEEEAYHIMNAEVCDE